MNSTDPSPVMDFAGRAAHGMVFHGHECVEVGTNKPMSFAAPTPEELDALTTPTARRQLAADWLFDQIEAQGYTDELAQLAEKLYEGSEALGSPDDTPDTFAEAHADAERLVTSAEALVDQFERDGESPELVAAIDQLVRNNDRRDD